MEVKQWVILESDTGKVIGTCEGTAQDARNMFYELQERIPWDEHPWTLYERSNVL